MRRAGFIASLVGAGALGFGLYYLLFPSPERVIRRTLAEVADAASFGGASGNLARIAGVRRLTGFFTADVEIDLGPTAGAVRRIQGREQLQELAGSARLAMQSLDVRFPDVAVDLGTEPGRAMAQLVVNARVDGAPDPIIHELRLRLVREGRSWRIHRIDPVRTLQ